MNPPSQQHIGIHKGHLITITETDIPNKAIDTNSNTWTFDKSWKMDYIPTGKVGHGITKHGIDRDSVWFESYRQTQESIAEKKLEEMMNGRQIANEEYLRKK